MKVALALVLVACVLTAHASATQVESEVEFQVVDNIDALAARTFECMLVKDRDGKVVRDQVNWESAKRYFASQKTPLPTKLCTLEQVELILGHNKQVVSKKQVVKTVASKRVTALKRKLSAAKKELSVLKRKLETAPFSQRASLRKKIASQTVLVKQLRRRLSLSKKVVVAKRRMTDLKKKEKALLKLRELRRKLFKLTGKRQPGRTGAKRLADVRMRIAAVQKKLQRLKKTLRAARSSKKNRTGKQASSRRHLSRAVKRVASLKRRLAKAQANNAPAAKIAALKKKLNRAQQRVKAIKTAVAAKRVIASLKKQIRAARKAGDKVKVAHFKKKLVNAQRKLSAARKSSKKGMKHARKASKAPLALRLRRAAKKVDSLKKKLAAARRSLKMLKFSRKEKKSAIQKSGNEPSERRLPSSLLFARKSRPLPSVLLS